MTLSRNWKIPLLPMSLRGQWMMVIVTYEPSVRQESLSISPGTDGQWSHGQEWNVPHCSHYTICITGGGHVNLHPAMRYKAYSIITFIIIKILRYLKRFSMKTWQHENEDRKYYVISCHDVSCKNQLLYLVSDMLCWLHWMILQVFMTNGSNWNIDRSEW